MPRLSSREDGPTIETDYFRLGDNTPRASFFGSCKHVPSQGEQLSGLGVYQELTHWDRPTVDSQCVRKI